MKRININLICIYLQTVRITEKYKYLIYIFLYIINILYNKYFYKDFQR